MEANLAFLGHKSERRELAFILNGILFPYGATMALK